MTHHSGLSDLGFLVTTAIMLCLGHSLCIEELFQVWQAQQA